MDIGERIKRRREALNMSQSDLARKVGYTSRSTINKIERDGRGISQDKIVAIAKALDTTPSYLMGWEEAVITEGGIITDYIADGILIEKIRKLSPSSRIMLDSIVDTLLKGDEERSKK